MLFSQLGLRSELLEAVAAKGYENASPIQEKSIPSILEGRDILGGAQTGTGKTAAFSLPLLQLLSESKFTGKRPRALILTPTRELAAQVQQSIVDYGSRLNLRSHVIFGGVGFGPQTNALRRGLDIIVATPGRLLDLCQRGDAQLSAIEILVLDEADRMLDMGFIHDIKKLIKLLPAKRQNLFFSATYSQEVKRLSESILNNPVEVEVTPRNSTVERIEQEAYQVGQKSKQGMLASMIKEGNWSQVLVFTRTKHGANRLATQLGNEDIHAMAIHGNKSQSARQRALASFKTNKISVLVATDIAARGLDIADLPFVVNYELPNIAEDYVHRIGRTGRAGKSGKAVSLVGEAEMEYLYDIEKLLKKEIPLYAINHLGERVDVDRSTIPYVKPNKPNGRGGGPRRGGGGNQQRSQNRRSPRGGNRRSGPRNDERKPNTGRPQAATQARSSSGGGNREASPSSSPSRTPAALPQRRSNRWRPTKAQ